MTVHGMQQHEQSSVLMQEHFPPCGFTMEPAALETEFVEAGILVQLSLEICVLKVCANRYQS